MNQSTVEKIREYLKKREHTLDADLIEIFEEVMGRKPSKAKHQDTGSITDTPKYYWVRQNQPQFYWPCDAIQQTYSHRKYTGCIE